MSPVLLKFLTLYIFIIKLILIVIYIKEIKYKFKKDQVECYIFINQIQQKAMDINDFTGLTKFKVIVPSIYICSWLAMIFGPVFFDVLYQRICIFFIIYIDVKVCILFTIMIIASVKNYKALKRVKQENLPTEATNRDYLDITEEINYGFILPNYKEEL